MDRKSIIGIALIILITLLMPYYQKWIMGDRIPKTPQPTTDTSEVKVLPDTAASTIIQKPPKVSELPQSSGIKQEWELSEIKGAEIEKIIHVTSRYLNITLTTARGGNPVQWELQNYLYYQGGNVDLANENGLDIEITNRDGKPVRLSNYTLYTELMDNKTIRLDEKHPTAEVEFYLPVENGRIIKRMIFYYDKYSVDVVVKFQGVGNYVINRRYFFNWNRGITSTEENVAEDNSYSRVYAYMAGELEGLDVSKEKEEKREFNGRVDWAAVRTKYFLAAIIPREPSKTNGVILTGLGKKEEGTLRKYYDVSLEVAYNPFQSSSDTFTVFIGPLDYGILKSYRANLHTLVMNRDWYERLFRPISLLILPAFKFLHRFIPNYGFVIIVFSILIKILLHPLTKKSYQSMSEMQYIQPQITALREKYKNDPQRLNKEMMRLYKEHGVNPLGGCLPMLLQMPLLFSLYIVFRSTIQLRGQPFILWITDLSRPDALHLGMSLPLFGDNIHVLPILMALTMIWQSKITMTDPKQKMMVYFMPLFMMFVFYSLPSGLNLYYTLFNVFSMVQTRWIKKKMHPDDKADVVSSPAAVKRSVERGQHQKKKKKVNR